MNSLKEITTNYLVEHLKAAYKSIKNGRGYICDGLACDYPVSCAQFEMFSRLSYGLLPLVLSKARGGVELLDDFNKGLLYGTNPDSESYWGEIKSPYQETVELIPLCLMLWYAKDKTWDTYSDEEQGRIAKWLLKINNGITFTSNWLFFRILVNTTLKMLKQNYSNDILEDCFTRLDKLYLGDGWYQDGMLFRVDYYNAFAFHFYGLLFADMDKCSEYANKLKERADAFAKNLLYFHSSQGDMVPMGRSLIYRMAEASFWSVEVFTNHYSIEKGIVKGLIERFFEFWNRQNIYNEQGILNIGYCYNNPYMTENYNTFGSPYWSYKFFVFLGCNDENFWSLEPQPLPSMTNKIHFKEPEFTVTGNADRSIVCIYPNADRGASDVVRKFNIELQFLVDENK